MVGFWKKIAEKGAIKEAKKFIKSGMPHITDTPSMLTIAKGLSKIAAPAAGYKVVAGSLHKDKKK